MKKQTQDEWASIVDTLLAKNKDLSDRVDELQKFIDDRKNWITTLKAEFDAEIQQAVKAERRAIAQYLVDQGTIMAGAEDVYYIDYDDIEAVRQGRYVGIHPD